MIAVYARYGLSLEYGEATGLPHLPVGVEISRIIPIQSIKMTNNPGARVIGSSTFRDWVYAGDASTCD